MLSGFTAILYFFTQKFIVADNKNMKNIPPIMEYNTSEDSSSFF